MAKLLGAVFVALILLAAEHGSGGGFKTERPYWASG